MEGPHAIRLQSQHTRVVIHYKNRQLNHKILKCYNNFSVYYNLRN